jgi:hypothetical protein
VMSNLKTGIVIRAFVECQECAANHTAPPDALREATLQLIICSDIATQTMRHFPNDRLAIIDAEIHLSTATADVKAALRGEKEV